MAAAEGQKPAAETFAAAAGRLVAEGSPPVVVEVDKRAALELGWDCLSFVAAFTLCKV